MDVRGKVALITGGVGGLGYGFTRILLSKGAKVCMLDVNHVKGIKDEKELAGQFGNDNVLFVKADVTNHEEFEKAFYETESKLGSVEIFCNNAGIVGEAQPNKLIQTNFLSVCYGTEIAVQRMRKDKGGKGGVIVNTSSILGLSPTWFKPIYASTKTAVYMYTKAWALNPNCMKMGLRFNVFVPSAVNTPLQDIVDGDDDEKTEAKLALDRSQGTLEVEEVSRDFSRLIEEDLHGVALLTSKVDGVKFVELTAVEVNTTT